LGAKIYLKKLWDWDCFLEGILGDDKNSSMDIDSL